MLPARCSGPSAVSIASCCSPCSAKNAAFFATIRASSWPSLFDCAHRWYFQNIVGLRMPSSGNAALGTAIHAGTAAFDGSPVVFEAKGRHDPSVLPRAVPVVESMAALVLADAFLQQQVQRIPRP